MNENLSEVQQLRDELAYQEHRIFVLESPTISSKDYWEMRDRLQHFERGKKQAISSDSASLRFPAPVRERFETFAHPQHGPQVPDLHFLSDLEAYYARLEAQEGIKPICVGTGRTSGPELELFYADGNLEKAILLQNNRNAIDVTDNARMIGSIPLILKPAGSVTDTRVSKVVRQAMGPSTMSPVPSYSEDLVIRGGVSMRSADLLALDRLRIDAGYPPYVDPKAAVTASICALDPRLTASRRLQFFAQDARNHVSGLETYWQLLSALKSWGFCVTPLTWRCESLPEVLDFVSALQREKRDFEYPLEGGGLHVDRLFGLQEDPEVSRSARLVFQETGREAKVKSVYFAIGRTGAVLPIALLEQADGDGPSVPDGAPIPAHSGSSVLQVRAQSVVRIADDDGAPPLLRLTSTSQDKGSSPIEDCPSCNSKLRAEIDEPFLYCDDRNCPGRERSRLLHLIGPNGLGLRSISIRTAEAALADEKVSLLHVLSLTPEKIDAVASGTGDDFAAEIAKWKKIPFWQVLYLSNIDHLSEQDARSLAAFVANPQGLVKLSEHQRPLEQHCGISPESYDGLSRWFESDGFKDLQALMDAGFEILDDDARSSAIFRGRRIVVAGDFGNLTREQIRVDIERHGGHVDSRVGRMTDLLIVGQGAKLEVDSAHYYGTALMNESLFLAILRTVEEVPAR
jgi:DNA ligase (NAD+)